MQLFDYNSCFSKVIMNKWYLYLNEWNQLDCKTSNRNLVELTSIYIFIISSQFYLKVQVFHFYLFFWLKVFWLIFLFVVWRKQTCCVFHTCSNHLGCFFSEQKHKVLLLLMKNWLFKLRKSKWKPPEQVNQ